MNAGHHKANLFLYNYILLKVLTCVYLSTFHGSTCTSDQTWGKCTSDQTWGTCTSDQTWGKCALSTFFCAALESALEHLSG